MINQMQKAIIKKDFKSVVSNKNLMIALIVVPLVFSIFLPVLFILITYFSGDDINDLGQLLMMLPESQQSDDIGRTLMELIINYELPIFFTIIPIMASSIMAASSFVGEKERRTLETLLYSPLTLSQIFSSKVWSAFMLSMLVTFASFFVMVIVVEVLLLLTFGDMLLPGLSWLFTMLVVAPAVSLLAIVIIVRGSAKAQTMEESQQRAVFLILPIILLVVGQFAGIILISAWYLLIVGVIVAVVAYMLMKKSMNKFTYELLLKK